MTVRSEVQAETGLALGWRQLTGAAGIASVVLSIILVAVAGDYPDINKSAGEIRNWFEGNGTTAQTLSYVNAIGLLFFFAPFLLGIGTLLGRAEGTEALWTQLGFLGGVLSIVLGLSSMAYTSILAVTVDTLDDATLIAVKHAEYTTAALAYGLGSGLYLLGTGAAIARTGALWRWLGWLGIALGVIAVVGTADLIDPDPESVLSALNFLAGSIGLLVVILLQAVGLLTKRPDDYSAPGSGRMA